MLIKQSLGLHGSNVVLLELILGSHSLNIALLLQKCDHFELALLLLVALLLLCQLQLLVSNLPELSKFFFFVLFVSSFLLLTLDLECSRTINSLLHFELTALLFLIQSVSLVLCLSHLLIQNLFLVVFKGTQLLHLFVDHFRPDLKLVASTVFNSFDSHVIHFQFLTSKFLDASLLSEFFLASELSSADLISVGPHDVSLYARSLLLPL